MPSTTTYNPDYQTQPDNQPLVRPAESRGRNLASWTLQIVLGVAFLFYGAMKLGGADDAIRTFTAIGFGQWFRYLTGTVEFVSAILVFTPRTAAVGALLLVCTMIGAICTHVLIIGGNPLMAIGFLALSTALVALRWNRARATIRQENVVNV